MPKRTCHGANCNNPLRRDSKTGLCFKCFATWRGDNEKPIAVTVDQDRAQRRAKDRVGLHPREARASSPDP